MTKFQLLIYYITGKFFGQAVINCPSYAVIQYLKQIGYNSTLKR